MKTYFKSNEIFHVWANQSAPMGRCPSAVTFDGETLKSYATAIARIINYKGKRAFIFDDCSFSVTTSGHQSAARSAVAGCEQKFFVHCGRRGQWLDFTPQTLRDYYLENFKRELPVEKLAFKHAENVCSKMASLEKAIQVCEFFGLAVAALKKTAAKFQPEYETAAKLLSDRREKLNAARELREENKRAQRTARAVANCKAVLAGQVKIQDCYIETHLLPDDLRAQYEAAQAKFESEKISLWQAGENISLGYDLPCFVRRENGELVTSKGARVPIEDAEKAYRFAKLKKSGWHKNGETCPVGSYELDAINEAGIVAGCHRIAWDEIERFAETQNWI